MVVKTPLLDEVVEGQSIAVEERKICNQVLRLLNLGGGRGPKNKF